MPQDKVNGVYIELRAIGPGEATNGAYDGMPIVAMQFAKKCDGTRLDQMILNVDDAIFLRNWLTVAITKAALKKGMTEEMIDANLPGAKP